MAREGTSSNIASVYGNGPPPPPPLPPPQEVGDPLLVLEHDESSRCCKISIARSTCQA
jgi:hypothetical protein